MAKITGPFLLMWGGVGSTTMCIQASYDGVDAPLLLQRVDDSGATRLQQWVYDSEDRRLYLYNGGQPPQYCIDIAGSVADGARLNLNSVTATDQTQHWTWNGSGPLSTLQNVGASGFCIDNSGGRWDAGNPIQLWSVVNNANQVWIFGLVPNLPR